MCQPFELSSAQASSSSQALAAAQIPRPIPQPLLPLIVDPRGEYNDCLPWIFLMSDRTILTTWMRSLQQELNSIPIDILPMVRSMMNSGQWENSSVLEHGGIGGRLQSCLECAPKFCSKIFYFLTHALTAIQAVGGLSQHQNQVARIRITRASAQTAISAISVLLWAGGRYVSTGQALDCGPWIQILLGYAKQCLNMSDNGAKELRSLPLEDQIIIRVSQVTNP